MKQFFKNSRLKPGTHAGMVALPALLALLMVPLPAAAETPEEATFGETVDVRVVNVEAVVTAKDGVRTMGLAPDDFRLLVDGEEVAIDFFTEFRGGQALREVGASPWEIAPISDTQAEGTSYLVFVDDFFTIGVDRNRVLRALEDELSFVGKDDRMAIVAWNGVRTEMLTSWSSSQRELKEALQRASMRPAEGLKRIVERRTILSGSFLSGGVRQAVGRRLDITERVYAQILIDQVSKASNAASAALRGFAAPSGRKVMLLVSGGWPYAPADFVTGDPVSARLDHNYERSDEIYGPLIETANLLGYTLYPLDAPGLQTTSGVSAASRSPFARDFGIRGLDFYREKELHDSLYLLANRTGGQALINGQREQPLSLVAADTRSFYWMGFTPDRTGDSKVRSIELQVKQPGFKVRTRSGYRDLSLEEEVTIEVESALLFGYPAHSNELSVEVGLSERDKRNRMVVPLTVGLPASAIALLPTGDNDFVADLEVRVASIDRRGDRSEVTTLPWRVGRTELPDGDERLEFTTALKMRRLAHDLIVAVYDTKTGALFSSSASVAPVS